MVEYSTGDGNVFGTAFARLVQSVTRCAGLVLVLFGVFVLYAAFESYNGAGGYSLELWALSVHFTEAGFLGPVSVFHQLVAFGGGVAAIGASIVLDSTRPRPLG